MILEVKRTYRITQEGKYSDIDFLKDKEKGWICNTDSDIDNEIAKEILNILQKLKEEGEKCEQI